MHSAILTTCFLYFVLNIVNGTGYYVSTSGSDNTGDGSYNNPFGTIGKAVEKALPGDEISVFGGTYYTAGTQYMKVQGAPEGGWISIAPSQGQHVCIDGSRLKLGQYSGLVAFHNSSFLNFTGFEIRNSNAGGIYCTDCQNVMFNDNYIHQIGDHAVLISGDWVTFNGNEVAFAALINTNDAFGSGGWPGAIMSWVKSDNSRSEFWTVVGNYVHDCWGEGIIADVNHILVQHNTIHDTFSVNIYLDAGLGASNVVVDSNVLYSTNKTYWRKDQGAPATGIEMATEKYSWTGWPLANIILSNNLIAQTGSGIGYWHDSQNGDTNANTYTNVSIVYNTIWQTFNAPFGMDGVPSSFVQPQNCMFANNIILSSSSIYVENPAAWTFSHNNWVNGIPNPAADKNSFAADPQFQAPDLANLPDGFKLQSGSSSIDKGIPLPGVTADYWGTSRSTSAPTVGFYEP